jgi:hypothetical protein
VPSAVTDVSERKEDKKIASKADEQSEEREVEARKEIQRRKLDATLKKVVVSILSVALVVFITWLSVFMNGKDFFLRSGFFKNDKETPEVRVDKKTLWLVYLIEGHIAGTFGPYTDMAECEKLKQSSQEMASTMVQTKRLFESGEIEYKCIVSDSPPM